MSELATAVVVATLVALSILRAVLPRRARVTRHTDGTFEIRRPLSRRVLELAGLGFWTIIVLLFVVASWWAEFGVGVVVGGATAAILAWRGVDRIRRTGMLINRFDDEVRDGENREGRASDVKALLVGPDGRQPIALVFREPGQSERRWPVPGSDTKTAAAIGQELADYLGVPLEGPPRRDGAPQTG